MGYIVEICCDECGFLREVSVGGTMSSFREHMTVPVYCRQCRDLTSANEVKSPLRCEVCGSPDIERAASGTPRNEAGAVGKQPGTTCPLCQRRSLRFGEITGRFD